MNVVLISIAALAVVVYITTTIMIYSYLKKQNIEVKSFLFINLFIFRYLNQYRTITKSDTGKVGPLYYLWLSSINIALVCIVLVVLFKEVL